MFNAGRRPPAARQLVFQATVFVMPLAEAFFRGR
jgi:hypothetical protein